MAFAHGGVASQATDCPGVQICGPPVLLPPVPVLDADFEPPLPQAAAPSRAIVTNKLRMRHLRADGSGSMESPIRSLRGAWEQALRSEAEDAGAMVAGDAAVEGHLAGAAGGIGIRTRRTALAVLDKPATIGGTFSGREAAWLSAWTRVENALIRARARGKPALRPNRRACAFASAGLAVRRASIEGLAVWALPTARGGSAHTAVGVSDAGAAAAERDEGADRREDSTIDPHGSILAHAGTKALDYRATSSRYSRPSAAATSARRRFSSARSCATPLCARKR